MGSRVAVLAISVALVGAGAACTDDEKPRPGVAQPVLLITCRDVAFPPNAFDRVTGAEKASGPQADVLRRVMANRNLQLPKDGWRELLRTGDTVVYGAGGPPYLTGYATATRVNGVWRVGTYDAGCTTTPFRRGKVRVEWGLDPAASAPHPDDRMLHVLANDLICAGTVSVLKRINPPAITVTPHAIIVSLTSRPPRGYQTCPGRPPAKLTAELPEALGTRDLLDGEIYPPQPPCNHDRQLSCNRPGTPPQPAPPPGVAATMTA